MSNKKQNNSESFEIIYANTRDEWPESNEKKLTAEETLHKHWKAWWEKSPSSKEMDLDIGVFQENNEDLEWILPAMEEYRSAQ